MEVAPMECALGSGSSSYNSWPMRPALPLLSAICLLLEVKWNKIEHRLFSYISINWRGKPLTSLELIIELISHTKTEEGLTVTAVKDANSYPIGIKVSDEEMDMLNITRDPFHGDWNYTIQPQQVVPLFQ